MRSEGKRKKVCFVTTVDWLVIWFLLDHIKAMKTEYDVTVVMNAPSRHSLDLPGMDVPVIHVGIKRSISVLQDIKATIQLFRLFRSRRFDVVHSIAPKSGLLAMTAAAAAGTKRRIHIFTGQVWATKSGAMKRLLRFMDSITAKFATHILTDSHSQADFIISQGVVSKEKISVLANGSVCGVKGERFAPNPRVRHDLRKRLGIGDSSILFLFLGRLNADKGVLDLAHAFSKVCKNSRNVQLLIVGPDEDNIRSRVADICETCCDRIHFVPYTTVPEHYMAAADVLCLPSYREGFGQVIIEAAATGIPAIGSRIYGITDAVVEGETGLMHEAGNVDDIAAQMIRIAEDGSLRRRMGMCARERALRDFSTEVVVSAMLDYYRSLV